jgi:phospholipid transport system transporter-binding protein
MTFLTISDDYERFNKYVRILKKEDGINMDLSDVRHCDSAGLALLIEAKRLSAGRNKTCTIQNIPKTVQSLAEFYGVHSILCQV